MIATTRCSSRREKLPTSPLMLVDNNSRKTRNKRIMEQPLIAGNSEWSLKRDDFNESQKSKKVVDGDLVSILLEVVSGEVLSSKNNGDEQVVTLQSFQMRNAYKVSVMEVKLNDLVRCVCLALCRILNCSSTADLTKELSVGGFWKKSALRLQTPPQNNWPKHLKPEHPTSEQALLVRSLHR